MSEDLKERIKNDILKSGFPLELEISRKLEDMGWKVFQNEYISDEKEEYEIDILGKRMFEKDINGLKFNLFPMLIIECKKSEKHPWVFFTREKQPFDKPHKLIKQAANFGVNKIFRLPEHKYLYDIDYLGGKINYEPLTIFSWKRKATSYHQSFRDPNKENQIYWTIKSLLRNLKIIHEDKSKTYFQGGWSEIILEMYYPIVVLDGNMFEGLLDKNDITIKDTNYIPLVINTGEKNLKRILIHIVQKNYFETFIKNIKTDSEKLVEEYSKISFTKYTRS